MPRTKDELPAEVRAAFETLERALESRQIDGWRSEGTLDGQPVVVLCVSVTPSQRLRVYGE